VPLSPAAKAIIDGMPNVGRYLFTTERPSAHSRVSRNSGPRSNAAVLNDLRSSIQRPSRCRTGPSTICGGRRARCYPGLA